MTPQTISLEIAKQLKEAGWSKRTSFYYTDFRDKWVCEYFFHGIMNPSEEEGDLSAPQLHEILEELPSLTWIERQGKMYEVRNSNIEPEGFQENENPHDAAALLWIWCVQNGYITLPTK